MIVSGGRKFFSLGEVTRGKLEYASILAIMIVLPVLLLSYKSSYADGWLEASKAGNEIKNQEISADGLRIGGIANTRHNLTMSYNGSRQIMDRFRNDYYEICVYCHTPHGANSTAAAPLWNRTVKSTKYTLYNQDVSRANEPSGLDLTYTQPGPNSLTCLSCHDGATAIDSIINMPTQLSGEFRAGYNQAQENTDGLNTTFLDAWSGNKLGTGSPGDPANNDGHAGFNTDGSLCMSCHNTGSGGQPPQGPDFSIFSIGDQFISKDGSNTHPNRAGNYLADDHPIGVSYPTKFDSSVDFNEPDIKTGRIAFFDNNGNAHADPDEVRLYDTGEGYEVECGSCHDPHGVKVENSNSNNIVPSFLRVGAVTTLGGTSGPGEVTRSNVGSGLCLTCHVK
ncbi:MAG: hypothetical protein OEX07_00935 [Gammaproteobacteria bacterium]|nr:hypothetical protein [Gammaproteobacteria bacterium]